MAAIRKTDRATKHKAADAKEYQDYKWLELTLSDGLRKLKVRELDNILKNISFRKRAPKQTKSRLLNVMF